MQASKLLAVAASVMAAILGATRSEAACTRLAFSVNDYGKDGPTKDANGLLDRYIADWTRQKGIKSYTVGKRDVSCELFLDFIVFDEHTCKASALVCWPGKQGPDDAAQPRAAAPAQPAPATKSKAR
jgi:hypothetical protein